MVEAFVFFKISVIISIVAIFAIRLIPEKIKSLYIISLLLMNIVSSSILIFPALNGTFIEIYFNAGRFLGNIPIRIDGLSAWFMLIINFTSLMGGIYGIGYMKTYSEQKNNSSIHWAMFLIFHLSMLLVCMVQNSLLFLIVWEIMSISSLLLVIFEHQKPETLKAGLNYLIQMHISIGFLTIAFLWVYFSENSFDFKSIATFLETHNSFTIFLLFFIGFGIKAGFVPFHTWLPHAHPAAPSHVSGVMSGVIVKMGIYGILRIVSYMNYGLLFNGEFVLIISLITAFYGILNSAVNRDLKKLLAFCTIENIGIIGIGIGIGLIGKSIGNNFIMFAGFSGALLHTLNHSLFKSLLFFTAGNIYSITHTRNMEHLGGLLKKMPITGFAFLIGALAISGLPPFNGFILEFLIYSGMIEGIQSKSESISSIMIINIAGLAMIGGLSLFTFTKTFGIIFLGSTRTQLKHEPKEVSKIMTIPLIIIISIILLIGIFPNFVFKPLISVVSIFGIQLEFDKIIPINILSNIGISSGIFIILVAIIYFTKQIFTKTKISEVSSTWGCGYISPNTKMQYTGKSYSKTLAKLFSFVAIEKKKYTEIDSETIFPKQRTFSAYYSDFIELYVIKILRKSLLRIFDLFTFIHNGKIQAYILYGIVFIIGILAATLFNLI